MAGVDHTCIYFHNGMLMKEISHYDWIERDDAWELEDGTVHIANELVCTTNEINLLPFNTTRDGLFTDDSAVNIKDMHRIFAGIYFKHAWQEKRAIKLYDKSSWKAADKYPDQDFENRVYWHKDDKKLIITQHTENYCLTFYFKFDTKDSWVVLGGYGHYANPFTHFYHRGYGEEFEKKMAHEAYIWICEELLPDLLDYCVRETLEEDEEYFMGTEFTMYYKALAEMLRFKHYWSMCNTTEEKEEHFNTDSMQYDPESIFPESKIIKAEPSEEFKRLVGSFEAIKE